VFGTGGLRDELGRSAAEQRPLSLYVHIPFCERLCYYCACTKEIISAAKRQAHDPSDTLLAGLEVEAGRFAALLDAPVRQVHLGGGSPTFLAPAALRRLWEALAGRFTVVPDAEIAVEIDPRITTREHLATLRELGFNRTSVGVQDFDPRVQKAVNREQPFAMVERVVGWCREFGFTSINFDLIYALPFQTLDSMARTLEQTLALAPDRIAFYRLAVIPEIFRWQNVFRPVDLPSGDLPLELNLLAINHFVAAGYEFIGLDHFAKPTEDLAQARRRGALHRTFQGMTTGKGLDVIGLGPSAISQLDGAYAQNHKATAAWQRAVTDDFATERGLQLSADDRLRRELIQQLYGHGVIAKHALEERFGIAFDDYFAGELERLHELIDEGVADHDGVSVRLTEPLGRLLVRVVAAVFDRYLPPLAFREGLAPEQSSKVG
jgi:oxygen-independent coproporphyrinogen-3 oxidase